MASHNDNNNLSSVQASLYELSQQVLTVQQNIRVLGQDLQESRNSGQQEIATPDLDSSPPAAAAHDNMEVVELESTQEEPVERESRMQTEEPVEVVVDNATQLSRVMMDAISGLYDCVSSIDIPPEFVFSALVGLYHTPRDRRMLRRWEDFQRHGVLEFSYCLHGILYWGHDDDHSHRNLRVADGTCYCRPNLGLERVNNAPINRSTRCIRVKRDGRKDADGNIDGKLCFSWGKRVGPCQDLTKWE
ncbi:hypothetical protein B0H65DRAFT_573008 [Neurospora tetraspora]|uniref:Uncharacterized protein n=1 Tax=Neurospora tetraspora TaxID=94610 RepID=A0AAE0JED0_9PEZI|nr:hypothetical protein B0H65DRAFT_573008 [Neurospora tetraspora]